MLLLRPLLLAAALAAPFAVTAQSADTVARVWACVPGTGLPPA